MLFLSDVVIAVIIIICLVTVAVIIILVILYKRRYLNWHYLKNAYFQIYNFLEYQYYNAP